MLQSLALSLNGHIMRRAIRSNGCHCTCYGRMRECGNTNAVAPGSAHEIVPLHEVLHHAAVAERFATATSLRRGIRFALFWHFPMPNQNVE